ncbi:hypothetical protein LEP1GSC074_2048 [Leptospira noguchii str. Hook]|nr:hypothetical protein LEP1GSC074_2048 [Leptospira noguchii str. Hook]
MLNKNRIYKIYKVFEKKFKKGDIKFFLIYFLLWWSQISTEDSFF